ncbi:hypothetical protein KAR91_05800 [Candidatus Pacearchaeota archaeon]|nr:hypothetical protein [Candidatus Pacearchaeota archaeon]
MSEVENAGQTDVNVSELSDEELEGQEIETAGGEESPEVTGEESQEDNAGEEDEGDVADGESSLEGEEAGGTEEQATISVAELEKLRKQVNQQEEFIQKRNTEFGELRKRESELQNEIANRPSDDDLREQFETDPLKTHRDLIAQDRADDERNRLQAQIQQLDAEEAISKAIPNFNELKDNIVALAKSDGLPERDIMDLQNNPYVFNPQDVISLARRAQDAKRIQLLEDQVSAISTSKQNMAKKISKAANSSRPLTAGSGQATPPNLDLSKKQLSDLSDAQLDELLEEDKN